MASDQSSDFFSHSRHGVSHISLRPHKYNREDKRTNRDLGQLQAQAGEFVTLCILCAFVDSHGRVFCARLLQKPLGMLIHLWLSSLTVSFCWPSFPLTALSRRLVSAHRYHLLSLCLCLLSDLPFLLHFRSCGLSRPQSFVWVSPQNRQRDRLSGANTNGNELQRIVSQKWLTKFWL